MSIVDGDFLSIFKEGELDPEAVCARFARTAGDGKAYPVAHCNLDVIISVGYRVKSQRGARLRIWATSPKGALFYGKKQRRLEKEDNGLDFWLLLHALEP